MKVVICFLIVLTTIMGCSKSTKKEKRRRNTQQQQRNGFAINKKEAAKAKVPHRPDNGTVFSNPALEIMSVEKYFLGVGDFKLDNKGKAANGIVGERYLRKLANRAAFDNLAKDDSKNILLDDPNSFNVVYNGEWPLKNVKQALRSLPSRFPADSGRAFIRFNLLPAKIDNVGLISKIKLDISLVDEKDLTLKTLHSHLLKKDDGEIEKFTIGPNGQVKVASSYTLRGENLPNELIAAAIKQNKQLAIVINDFDIKYNYGKTITYKELRKKVIAESARIIFSTPDETREYFVKKGTAFKQIWEDLSLPVKFDAGGELVSIDNFINTLEAEVDWDNINVPKLSHARWQTIPEILDNETVEAGKSYLVTYNSLKDMLLADRSLVIDQQFSLSEGEERQIPLKIGDIVTVELSGINLVPQFSGVHGKVVQCGKHFHNLPDHDFIRFDVPVNFRSHTGTKKVNISLANVLANRFGPQLYVGGKRFGSLDFVNRPHFFYFNGNHHKIFINILVNKEILSYGNSLTVRNVEFPPGQIEYIDVGRVSVDHNRCSIYVRDSDDDDDRAIRGFRTFFIDGPASPMRSTPKQISNISIEITGMRR